MFSKETKKNRNIDRRK